jgi:hypothetical protein
LAPLPSSLNVKSLFTVKRWGKPDLKIVLSQEKNIISETSQIAHVWFARMTKYSMAVCLAIKR